jgi:hypothetical protein
MRPDPEWRYRDMDEVSREMEATASPLGGTRPLAALVQHLMEDAAFDPFDVVRAPEAEPVVMDIPAGEQSTTEYADLQIQVNFGAGSPGSMIRAVVPDRAPPPPSSPFLETLDAELDASEALGVTP